MPESVVRGNPITREATFTDVNGDLIDAVLPTVSIVDPNGTTLVSNVTPTHVSTGRYEYVYNVAADAQLGAWASVWTGTINGEPVDASEGFTVLPAAAVTPDPGEGVQEGPCAPWVTWAEVEDVCTPAEVDEGLQDMILAAATRTLWNRSCQQFGLCAIARARVLPLCSHGFTWRTGYAPGYYPTPGWGGCGCGGYTFLPIDLGTAPVASVQGVWIDGVELDADSYRVDDWRRLVRTDGERWGATSLQPDEGGESTIEVSWTYGVAVPPDGKMAAALLACKKAAQIAETCAPSGNASQVNREGVTIILNAPDGDTGIVLVEEWLGNFHCGGGAIFDPGARKAIARVNT